MLSGRHGPKPIKTLIIQACASLQLLSPLRDFHSKAGFCDFVCVIFFFLISPSALESSIWFSSIQGSDFLTMQYLNRIFFPLSSSLSMIIKLHERHVEAAKHKSKATLQRGSLSSWDLVCLTCTSEQSMGVHKCTSSGFGRAAWHPCSWAPGVLWVLLVYFCFYFLFFFNFISFNVETRPLAQLHLCVVGELVIITALSAIN